MKILLAISNHCIAQVHIKNVSNQLNYRNTTHYLALKIRDCSPQQRISNYQSQPFDKFITTYVLCLINIQQQKNYVQIVEDNLKTEDHAYPELLIMRTNFSHICRRNFIRDSIKQHSERHPSGFRSSCSAWAQAGSFPPRSPRIWNWLTYALLRKNKLNLSKASKRICKFADKKHQMLQTLKRIITDICTNNPNHKVI